MLAGVFRGVVVVFYFKAYYSAIKLLKKRELNLNYHFSSMRSVFGKNKLYSSKANLHFSRELVELVLHIFSITFINLNICFNENFNWSRNTLHFIAWDQSYSIILIEELDLFLTLSVEWKPRTIKKLWLGLNLLRLWHSLFSQLWLFSVNKQHDGVIYSVAWLFAIPTCPFSLPRPVLFLNYQQLITVTLLLLSFWHSRNRDIINIFEVILWIWFYWPESMTLYTIIIHFIALYLTRLITYNLFCFNWVLLFRRS